MIIQILLTLGLSFCVLYALFQKRESKYLNALMYLVAVVGTYFVWLPDHATRAAHLVGVGRGADLVLYLWVLVTIIIGLNLHLKLQTEKRRTTLLARHLAMRGALEPDAKSTDPIE